ncbi:MAG: hypothetical protein O3A14_19020 [Cyanobacteria bacterium]|nr:hypothetical protein [Cyanobacteriota bacterium]
MSYFQFIDESGLGHGSFQVFEITDWEMHSTDKYIQNFIDFASQVGGFEVGWYWWEHFPSCSPDNDPSGPFDSEEEAVNAAGGLWDYLSPSGGAVG